MGTRRAAFTPYWLLLPGLLFLIALLVYPIASGFVLSLQNYTLSAFSVPEFIGFGNYQRLLSNANFVNAVGRTLIFVAVSLSLEFFIGMLYALLLHQRFPGRNIVRAIMLLPWMVAPVIVAFLWSWLMNGSYGLLNYILLKLGIISTSINFLSSVDTAFLSVTLVDVWHTTPFVALVLLAGMQGIPEELYEAARIDGAGRLQSLYYITLPLLKPAASVALLMRTMVALRFFDIVWIMTRGGPGGTTEVMGTYAYKESMINFQMSYGSAATTIIFLISFVLSIGYVRIILSRRD